MTQLVLVLPSALSQRLGDAEVVVLDTRDAAAFAAGHVPGAVNIPEIFTHLATSSPEGMIVLRATFARLLGDAGLSGSEIAVLVEESLDSGFGRSCRRAFLLAWLGYPSVAVLDGGMAGWRAAGFPLSTEAASPSGKSFPSVDGTGGLMATREDVLGVLAEPDGTVLLDVRDVDEWTGASSSPCGVDFCPRKGRIPGARWLEWYRMMRPGPHGPRLKGPRRGSGRMRDGGRRHPHAGHIVLLQGIEGGEHVARPSIGRLHRRPHLFRVMERMVPRSRLTRCASAAGRRGLRSRSGPVRRDGGNGACRRPCLIPHWRSVLVTGHAPS